MQSEFGAEIGDRAVQQVRVVVTEPGPVGLSQGGEASDQRVVALQKVRVGGTRLEPRRIDLAQQGDGIVPGEVPEGVVDRPEQPLCLGAPAPPEIASDVPEQSDTAGQRRFER